MRRELPPGPFHLHFVPELWTPLDWLRELTGPPFPHQGPYVEGLMMMRAHFAKYGVLAGLANRIKPELAKDQEELEREGSTPAVRSREFAAVTETLVSELYSVLGGMRLMLCGAYPKASLPEKTSRFFKNAAEGKTGGKTGALPDEIRLPVAAAYGTWFPLLRTFRTSITHRESGYATLLVEKDTVQYIHAGFMDGPRPFVREDIVSWINEQRASVQALVDDVVMALFSRLEPVERETICGLYRGRIYQRTVVPGAGLTRESGRCFSRQWFEKEPGYECPLRRSCSAYMRAGGQVTSEAAPSPPKETADETLF